MSTRVWNQVFNMSTKGSQKVYMVPQNLGNALLVYLSYQNNELSGYQVYNFNHKQLLTFYYDWVVLFGIKSAFDVILINSVQNVAFLRI